jgi:AcrR family transcriptional regulator
MTKGDAPAIASVADSEAVPGRRRRAGGEVRRLLIGTAQEMFVEKGYANTTTRLLAEEAGVSEALLFRHFKTKDNLFRQAIAEPFAEVLANYVQQYDPRLPAAEFQAGLYRILRDNRGTVMALFSAELFESEFAFGEVLAPLEKVMDGLEDILRRDVEYFHLENIDTYISARLCFASALSLAVFDGWLFPTKSKRPSRQRLIDEMLVQLVHGLAHHPPLDASASPEPLQQQKLPPLAVDE